MPLGAIGRARAGLNVAGQKLAASAHNTANMATEGYHEVDVTGVEDSGAVRVQIRTTTREGVDPVAATIDRTVAALTYRANLAVVKRADDMLGETMDILG